MARSHTPSFAKLFMLSMAVAGGILILATGCSLVDSYLNINYAEKWANYVLNAGAGL